MKALDLCCGAGGASVGLARAVYVFRHVLPAYAAKIDAALATPKQTEMAL